VSAATDKAAMARRRFTEQLLDVQFLTKNSRAAARSGRTVSALLARAVSF
jgi:hypothetical protein